MKHPWIIAIAGIALSLPSATLAQSDLYEPSGQEMQGGNGCSTVHQGRTSRFAICHNGVGWTLPRDAFRIDRPLRPGPNALPNQARRRYIEKPLRWLGRRLGL